MFQPVHGLIARPLRKGNMNNKPEMSRRRTQFNKARLGGLFHFVVQHMNDAAIAMLDVRAKNCEHNEPIQRAEGKLKQARLTKRLGKSYRDAIELLERVGS